MSCPLCPRDSQLQQDVSSIQEQYKDELSMLRESRIWAEADIAGAENTRTGLPFHLSFYKLGSTSVVQEKTHCLPKLAEDQRGNKCLPPRHRNREYEINDGNQKDPLKSKLDVVLSIVNGVNVHELTDAVKLKVQLQGSQWITSQNENRTAGIIERKLIFNLKSQFVDFSFLVIVVEYGHIVFVSVNLKDGFLERLVEVRSLHRYSCRFSSHWRQQTPFFIDLPVYRVNKSICSGGQEASKTLLCIREICKVYIISDLPGCSVNKSIRTGKGEDCLKQSCFDDIGKGDCIPDTLTKRLEEDRCSRLLTYWKTFLIQVLKSCKVILHKKGSIVICLLLVIGAISGTKLSSRTCSVSSHLERIPSKPLKVGEDMKLICRHNCSKGTPRWDQDKPIGRKLTYNGNVLTPNKQRIELEIIENEYNIIFLNATFADINSTYTCHYGFDWTHISPINYYTVLPTDKSTSKQSVYKNNVLNGTLEFEEVYPLPECFSYCDDKRQKEIPICKTCKIWKRNFYKVKFIFNIALNNKICREENVSVRCAVGRNHYTYDFSILTKKKKNNKETTKIVIGIIIGVIFLVGLFVLGRLHKRGSFSRCWRDTRNVEHLRGIGLNEIEQNKSQEEERLLHEEAPNLNTNNSNGQKSQIKPGVKNEGTPVQSCHNAVNSCEECNGTGQMPQAPDGVAIPVYCNSRKSGKQPTIAIGSEMSDTDSKKENTLENTNVKDSEKITTSDVPNLHADSSLSGDSSRINPDKNAEEE